MRKTPPGGIALLSCLECTPRKVPRIRCAASKGDAPSLYTREADLAAMSIPLLVMCGDEDDPCLQPSLFLKRTVPGCGLIVLPHTGHACNLEEPAAFNAAVAEFLAQVAAGRWGPRPADSGDNWAATAR